MAKKALFDVLEKTIGQYVKDLDANSVSVQRIFREGKFLGRIVHVRLSPQNMPLMVILLNSGAA